MSSPTRERSRLAHRLLVAPLMALAVALGAGLVGPVPQASAAGRTELKHAVQIALAQLGDPYRYGAAGPSAFDCSGVGSSRVDLQACKLEYSIVSPK